MYIIFYEISHNFQKVYLIKQDCEKQTLPRFLFRRAFANKQIPAQKTRKDWNVTIGPGVWGRPKRTVLEHWEGEGGGRKEGLHNFA